MAAPSLLVIHCSDTPNGRYFDARDILRWHTDPKPMGNGWKKAGYHFVIPPTAEIQPLVELDGDEFLEPWEIANGVRGYNGQSIHVCLIGRDRFFTNQWVALTDLTERLGHQFRGIELVGHRDLDPHKTCPGFSVADWLRQGRGVFEQHAL